MVKNNITLLTNSKLRGGRYSLINNYNRLFYKYISHGMKNIMAFSCPKGCEKL